MQPNRQSRTTDQKIPFNSNATAYTMYPNLSVSVNGTLYWPCNVSYAPAAPHNTAIEHQSFNEMIAEMTFDPKTLSKNTRRYISAPDDRTSSVIIGTFAMAVIFSVVSFILLLDSSRLVTWIAKMTPKCRKLKMKFPTRSLASIEQSSKPHCNDFRDDPLSQSPVRDLTEVQERPGRPPLLRHHYRRWSKRRLASVVQSPDNVTLSEIN
ncbi:hypothetical protein MAR_026094 [Mya arenaria]|uniref:Uncharacterized protein n=1 Tax=Mya arenaria TaxID=6604 RepID=A0ABY7EU40_MYAAR|nr:hypothetical protein MAR_026094 [Mya arenaria]